MSDSKTYHAYVFDVESRQFLGRFEDMYRAERQYGFDSWHQDDLTNLTKRICLEVLASYNFDRILDIGCGKGAFTQLLKRQNNSVIGVDVSPTALTIAQARFSDIEFVQADLDVPEPDLGRFGGRPDAVVCVETLSYLRNWEALLAECGRRSEYALVALYLPDDPIGFVKSFEQLLAAFSGHFTVIEDIRLPSRRQVILLGRAKAGPTERGATGQVSEDRS